MADTLALFDLDFTLIPFDSGLRWARFMVGEGVLAPGTDEAYLNVCRGYVAGQVGIDALHRFAAQRIGEDDAFGAEQILHPQRLLPR